MGAIAVTGGTGFVGRHLVRTLLARGHSVRVLARDLSRLPFPADAVQVVRGALADDAALDRLAAGADALVHLVGIIAETADVTFEGIHVEGTRRAVAAATRGGVGRLVHMSAVGARHEASATPYHRTKAGGEDVVRAAGLPFVILRPAVIVGPESAPIAILARLHRWLPAVPVFGAGDFPMQPVWIGDVTTAFALAAEGVPAQGVHELGGPAHVTYVDFVRAVGRAAGRPRPVVHVPLTLARVAASAFDFLPAALAPITTDQLQMLVEGGATPDNAIERVFGIEPLGLDEALRRALERDERRGTGDG